MSSIRLSVTLCFLGLLLVSLGAVSLFVYREMEQTLQDELDAENKSIQAAYKERHRQIEADLNEELLSKARRLASELQFRLESTRVMAARFHAAFTLQAIPALAAPNGNLLAPWYLSNAHFLPFPYVSRHHPLNRSSSYRFWNRFVFQIRADSKAQISLVDIDVLKPNDVEVVEYFQINSAWGSTYYSPNLDGRSFAFDPAVLSDEQVLPEDNVLAWTYADAALGDDRVRIVRLKAPAARLVPGAPSWSGPTSRAGSGSRTMPTGRSRFSRRRRPALYIQVARVLSKHDVALAELAQLERDDLAQARADTEAAQKRVGKRLLMVMGVTFAVTALGAFWLVGVSLIPVRRLSDAVSRISEKDVRLEFDDAHVPNEVTPLVAQLKSMLEQLKRAFDREKQATADISHDLRTPLAALLTTVDFALRRPRSPEEYREALTECRQSGQQMNQIVERLLTLARLDAGSAHLHLEPVNVHEIAEQCVAVVRPLAEARSLTLALHGDDPVETVADADKLREVLTNLLHNAVQYNHVNGAIDVTVERPNGQLRLQVRDTGIGISPRDRDRIFERFFRADPSRSSDDLNAGLGLAIVQGYVELMGGSVDVDSTEGTGSTFIVELPLQTAVEWRPAHSTSST